MSCASRYGLEGVQGSCMTRLQGSMVPLLIEPDSRPSVNSGSCAYIMAVLHRMCLQKRCQSAGHGHALRRKTLTQMMDGRWLGKCSECCL